MKNDQRKPLDHYLGLSYPFQAIADEGGGWTVFFPDLPGCLSEADTPDEIGLMADEARRLWIETEYERGSDIPLPSMPGEYSGRFNLRIPKSLHRKLAETAEREGVSLNQLVTSLLSDSQGRTQSSRQSGAIPHGRARSTKGVSVELAWIPSPQTSPILLRLSSRGCVWPSSFVWSHPS